MYYYISIMTNQYTITLSTKNLSSKSWKGLKSYFLVKRLKKVCYSNGSLIMVPKGLLSVVPKGSSLVDLESSLSVVPKGSLVVDPALKRTRYKTFAFKLVKKKQIISPIVI